MEIMDFLSRKAVTTDLKHTDKQGVIKELVELLIDAREIKDKDSRPPYIFTYPVLIKRR